MKRLLLVVRTLGIGWLCFRVTYALKHKLGWFRFRCPQRDWSLSSEGLNVATADYMSNGGPLKKGSDPLEDDKDNGDITRPERVQRTDELGHLVRERLSGPDPSCDFAAFEENGSNPVIAEADQVLAGSFSFYSSQRIQLGYPPNWHTNPVSGETIASDVHWSRLSDFAFGDIKHVWETARFGSAFALARAYWLTHDERYAEGFWQLVEDWCVNNPPNSGVHWKCGQEVALRLMAVLFAGGLVKDAAVSTSHRYFRILQLASASATRIDANLKYALSQNNNHGISEAAGLYLVGLLFPELTKGQRWKSRGKQKLEQQIQELIDEDGGFSQHSLNYQRLTLQVLLLTLLLMDRHGDSFSANCIGRIVKCSQLLASLCNAESGHVPLLGPNDGALLLPLNSCDYRDYRPVVQAMNILLLGRRLYAQGPWDEDLFWLDIADVAHIEEKNHHPPTMADGYKLLKAQNSSAFFRCPERLRFRPNHSDQLHFELWHRGINVLPDGGSYSYNDELMPYFRGVEAHNTIQFDDRDQMPVLGRFLYGQWLTARVTESGDGASPSVTAEYRDYLRAQHSRTIEWSDANDVWIVRDQICGFQRHATLRWRLNPEWKWTLAGCVCQSEFCRIEIESDDAIDIRISEGWVSWYYSQKERLPVLEVTTRESPGTLTSKFSFTVDN